MNRSSASNPTFRAPSLTADMLDAIETGDAPRGRPRRPVAAMSSSLTSTHSTGPSPMQLDAPSSSSLGTTTTILLASSAAPPPRRLLEQPARYAWPPLHRLLANETGVYCYQNSLMQCLAACPGMIHKWQRRRANHFSVHGEHEKYLEHLCVVAGLIPILGACENDSAAVTASLMRRQVKRSRFDYTCEMQRSNGACESVGEPSETCVCPSTRFLMSGGQQDVDEFAMALFSESEVIRSRVWFSLQAIKQVTCYPVNEWGVRQRQMDRVYQPCLSPAPVSEGQTVLQLKVTPTHRDGVSLTDLLNERLNEEPIRTLAGEYECCHCHQRHVNCRMVQHQFASLPPVLVLAINRSLLERPQFSGARLRDTGASSAFSAVRAETRVCIPQTLNLRSHMTESLSVAERGVYRLHALSLFAGNRRGDNQSRGHYTAAIPNADDYTDWWVFSDDNQPVQLSEQRRRDLLNGDGRTVRLAFYCKYEE